MTNKVDIHCCTGCRWLLRSAWMAQELLTTFEDASTNWLHPGQGGIFEVWDNSTRIWSRKEQGDFGHQTARQLVRDEISPDRSLGHSRATGTTGGD